MFSTNNYFFLTSQMIRDSQNGLKSGPYNKVNDCDCDCDCDCNCDCACSTYKGWADEVQLNDFDPESLFYSNALTEHLHAGFKYAFNPFSDSGVVILNQPAGELLQAFQSPQTPARVASQTPDPAASNRAIHQLVKLGLVSKMGANPSPAQRTSTTLSVWLSITHACNLACDYCYRPISNAAMSDAIGEKSIRSVIRVAQQHGFQHLKIKYAGGESTLYFERILALHQKAQEYVQKAGLSLDGIVLSNGVGLSREQLIRLQASGLKLMISLDGIREYHDRQRHFRSGRGSFAAVEHTLDLSAAISYQPVISLTVSGRNLPGLTQAVKYLLDRDLPFSINFYRETPRSIQAGGLEYQSTEMIAALLATYDLIEQRIPGYNFLGAFLDRVHLDTFYHRVCGAGQNYLVIDPYGGIAKCPMQLDQVITQLDDPDPLMTLQQDQTGLQNLPVEEKEGCAACQWKYWCAGGCPALTHHITGRYAVPSPNCVIYQTLIPHLLRLEAVRLFKYGEMLL